MNLPRWFEWIAFAASAIILLRVAYWIGTFLYVFGPALVNPCTLAYGNFAKNGRGDLVEEQVRDCAIIGSAAQDRIGLSLAVGWTSLHWSTTARTQIRASRVCAGSTTIT
jgi:hypothetical protein